MGEGRNCTRVGFFLAAESLEERAWLQVGSPCSSPSTLMQMFTWHTRLHFSQGRQYICVAKALSFFFSHSTCRIYSDLAWSWMSPVGPKQVLKAVCSPVSYQVSAKFHCSPVSPGASQRHRSRHRFFQFQFTLNTCNCGSSIQGFSSRLLGSWIMVDCAGGLILEPRALRQSSFMVV